MPPASPSEPGFRAPHPLTERLLARIPDRAGIRILEVGTGSGRNAAALAAAGLAFVSIGESAPIAPLERAGSFAAALSTHALLHGTPATIRLRLLEIARVLEPGGLLYATFGSTRDARFGRGERIDAATYAPSDGDEAGVAHAFFDEARLRELLGEAFAIAAMEEVAVDEVAGKWAHANAPLRDAVHWFVEAERGQ
jgi:SAM-dependent methyltransferase